MGQLPDFMTIADQVVEWFANSRTKRMGLLKRKIETALKEATMRERRRAITIARNKARELQGLNLGMPGARDRSTVRVARAIAEEIADGTKK